MSEKHFGEIETGNELEEAIREAAASIPDEEEVKEETPEGAVDVSEEELDEALKVAREREEQEK